MVKNGLVAHRFQTLRTDGCLDAEANHLELLDCAVYDKGCPVSAFVRDERGIKREGIQHTRCPVP